MVLVVVVMMVMVVVVVICCAWVNASIWYHQGRHTIIHAYTSISEPPVSRRGVPSGGRVTFVSKYHTNTTTLIALICCK